MNGMRAENEMNALGNQRHMYTSMYMDRQTDVGGERQGERERQRQRNTHTHTH